MSPAPAWQHFPPGRGRSEDALCCGVQDVSINLQDAVALDTVTATGASKVTLTNLANTTKSIDGSANTGGVIVVDVGDGAVTLKGGTALISSVTSRP